MMWRWIAVLWLLWWAGTAQALTLAELEQKMPQLASQLPAWRLQELHALLTHAHRNAEVTGRLDQLLANLSLDVLIDLHTLMPARSMSLETFTRLQELFYHPDLTVDEKLEQLAAYTGLEQVSPQDYVHRSLCIWDIAGRNGPIFTAVHDQKLRLLKFGITLELIPFTNERVMVEDFKSGRCDAALMSGLRARQFNLFTGSVDAFGAVPDLNHMKYLLEVLAHPQMTPRMRHGDYIVMAVAPAGNAYPFVSDSNLRTLPMARGRRIGVLDDDHSMAELVAAIGATPVRADLASFAGKFNEGVVDVIVAPPLAYEVLELNRGMSPRGGISSSPVTLLSLQLIGRRERFPDDVAYLTRQAVRESYQEIRKQIEANRNRIPAHWWVKATEAELRHNEQALREVRSQLRKKGLLDGDMLALLRGIRCKLDSSRAECVMPAE